MSNPDTERAITAMEVEALNFAYRCTKDAATRQWYIQQTQAMSRQLRQQYSSGQMSARKAAEAANQMRNEIMEMARLRSSDIGRARALQLKAKGLALDDLVVKYSQQKFGTTFQRLTKAQQDQVLLEIVDAAGRSNPRVNAGIARTARIGRALWVLSAVIAVYKTHQAGREVANVGGGFAGGAAAGALAGIWFGPLGVAVGVAIGGVVGAMVADEAYSELTTPKDPRVANILPRFTGMFSFDEEGLARALYDECGMDLDRVYAVFREIHQDHGGDADAAANAYVKVLRERGGPPLHALRMHGPLRQMLTDSLRGGWWVTGEEERQAAYLQTLR
jgi:hypothetical protein